MKKEVYDDIMDILNSQKGGKYETRKISRNSYE
jgi:hypothetical protein